MVLLLPCGFGLLPFHLCWTCLLNGQQLDSWCSVALHQCGTGCQQTCTSEEVAHICGMALQTRSSRVVPGVREGLGSLGGPHILLLTLPIPRGL